MKFNPVIAAFSAIFIVIPSTLHSAPLKSATVTEVKNEVRIARESDAERAAAIKDTVAGRDVLRTGKKSRAELEFSDKSIARLGSNTVFSFDPQSRDMRIDRGTALIHVPPGLSGAKISTPAATAAIHGDVVAMRVNDQGVTQVVALLRDAAGPVTVTFNKTGESRTLEPGQLLTLDPMATRIPEPLNVAVDVFVQTSNLAGGFKKELPATAQNEIKQAQVIQEREIRSGNLEGAAGKLMAKMDASPMGHHSTVDSNTNLATSGSRFAGTYSGQSFSTGGPGCLPAGTLEGSFILTVAEDGRITGMTGGGGTLIGLVNDDGSFRAVSSNGGIGAGVVSGTSFIGRTHNESDPACGDNVIRGSR